VGPPKDEEPFEHLLEAKLREQLKLLEKLQQVDAKLQEKEDTFSTLPVKLKSLKSDVSRVEALLEGERHQLAEVRHYREELEGAIKADQDQLSKSKNKLTQVRTSKEYMASQREFEATRKATGGREEELIKLMEAIEQFQKSIKEHEEELAALKDHVLEEEKDTESKLQALEKERQAHRVEREAMTKTIRKDVLAQYETIRKRRGLAVVAARHGVCTGCNMHLPPQLFNILHRGTTIEHCPSCRRIIYFEPDDPT
jgi:uncharacterized protein